MAIEISKSISISESEIKITAIRASGPGGQHANKVSTAVQIQFNITASTLPIDVKNRLLNVSDHRISNEGVITIKSQESRSQIKNKEEAISRLKELIKAQLKPQKKRKRTKPTLSSKLKRLHSKKKRSDTKSNRKKPIL